MSLSFMDMVLVFRLWERGLSGPSPGRAPDRCDRWGEGCPPVIPDPADLHIHALFYRESQSFLLTGALILQAKVFSNSACLGWIRISGLRWPERPMFANASSSASRFKSPQLRERLPVPGPHNPSTI